MNSARNSPLSVVATNLTKTFGKGSTAVTALRNVSVDFTQGQFTAVMGPSGSGKSTLMQCLAGLDRFDSGTVHIEGVDLGSLSEKDATKLRRDRIGFIFQAFNLVPTLTAAQNIVLPFDIAKKSVDKTWFDQVISTLGLGDRLTHKPHELSGGQQQRVAVARALLARPAVIFADEPTGNLDSAVSKEVLQLLQQSARTLQQSVIMVTHDALAASYADRVLFLADGVIVDELHQPTETDIFAALHRISHGADAQFASSEDSFAHEETALAAAPVSVEPAPATRAGRRWRHPRGEAGAHGDGDQASATEPYTELGR